MRHSSLDGQNSLELHIGALGCNATAQTCGAPGWRRLQLRSNCLGGGFHGARGRDPARSLAYMNFLNASAWLVEYFHNDFDAESLYLYIPISNWTMIQLSISFSLSSAACTFSSFKSLLVLNISRPQDQAIEVCDLDSVWPSGSGSLDRESFRQRLRARGASSDRGIDTLFNAFTGGTYLITRFAWVCTCANTIFSIHKHYSLRAGARKIENWHSLLATSALDGQELKEKLKYGVSICFYASETLSAKFQQSIPQEALITWSKVEHLPWITRLLSADPQSCFVMPAGVMRRRRHCKLAAQAARWIPELWLVVFLVPGFKSSALGSSWMSSRFLRHTFSSVDRCFTNLGLICYQLCPDIGKIPRLYSLTACSCLEKRRWMWRARSMQALMTVCIPTSSFMFFATLIYLVHLSSVY